MKTVANNLTGGSLLVGDVCSYQIYSLKYQLNDKIRVNSTKLNGVRAYIFSGGYGLDTSTTKTEITVNVNYQFPAD